MAYDKFKYINKRHSALINEFGDVEGVKELADKIKVFHDSEWYEKFANIFIFNYNNVSSEWKMQLTEENGKKLVAQLAYENMSHPLKIFRFILHPMPKSDLLIFHDFRRMYPFFVDVYEMNTGKRMNYDEIRKMQLSKLDERLVFALDKFDEATETPEPTEEYFQKLKKVKWEDKKTKEFLERLHGLHKVIQNAKWGILKGGLLGVSERGLTRFLAGCNAVNDNRSKINMQDVIKAYNTYFRLLKTDLQSLVDKLWEEQYNA